MRLLLTDDIEGMLTGTKGYIMDIQKLSLRELKQLQEDVSVAISNQEKLEKRQALEALRELAEAKGFTLSELLDNAPSQPKKRVVAPKYQNPSNPEETWSGRGRKPKWFEAEIAAGKTVSELEISET